MTDYKAKAKAAAQAKARQFAKNNPGTADLRNFIREFDKFPADIRAEMRPMLLRIGQQAEARAKRNFAWSHRIPRAIKLQVSFSKSQAGIRLVGNLRVAPHLRAYEHLGREGWFRAPTGNPPEPWVVHRARPGFFEAVDVSAARNLDTDIGKAVDVVSRKHGFR